MEQTTEKLSGTNQQLFIGLTDSVNQEFGQDIAEVICLYSMMSGASVGELEN